MRLKKLGLANYDQILLLVLITFTIFVSGARSFAATLEWDANSAEVAGYKVYVGSQSRQYDTIIDVGAATQTPLQSLLPGQTYYLAVTAYLSDGMESDFSEEVSYVVSLLTTASALTNLNACAGETASFVTTPAGVGPFGFVWRKNGLVIPGRTEASLTLEDVSATDAGLYAVQVTGVYNTVTNAAWLIVNEPVTATPVVDVVAFVGDSASFAATVNATGSLRFVWRKDGAVIDGATNAILTLSNVSPVNAGAYSVEVWGACTSVTSVARLTVWTGETDVVPVLFGMTFSGAASPVAVSFFGEAGRRYCVQASSDLQSWRAVHYVLAEVTGTSQWSDTEAPNHPARFYRVLGSQF